MCPLMSACLLLILSASPETVFPNLVATSSSFPLLSSSNLPFCNKDVDAADWDIGSKPSSSSSSSSPSSRQRGYKTASAATNSNIEAYALSALESLKNKAVAAATVAAATVAETTGPVTTKSKTSSSSSPFSLAAAASKPSAAPPSSVVDGGNIRREIGEWVAAEQDDAGPILADLEALMSPQSAPLSPSPSPPSPSSPSPSSPPTIDRDFEKSYRSLLKIFHQHNPLYSVSAATGELLPPPTLPPSFVASSRRKTAALEAEIAALTAKVGEGGEREERGRREREEIEGAIVEYLNIGVKRETQKETPPPSTSPSPSPSPSASPSPSPLPSSLLNTALISSLRTSNAVHLTTIASLGDKVSAAENWRLLVER